jgi:hypothetical protein
MTENERTLRALLTDSCREVSGAGPEQQAERLAKRLADAEVLAVSSISAAVADAAVKDILQLLGEARINGTASRGHGEKLIEVLKRLAAGRVNPGSPAV